MAERIKPSLDIDYLFNLAEDAWALSEEEINQMKPGSEGADLAIKFLNVPLPADRPLLPKTKFDKENPHIHLLNVMMQPEFFPYTCKTLFNRPDGSGPLTILPFQQLTLQELWWRQFPLILFTRGGGKSFLLALYALLRATFTPGSKIVITGSGFRQAKGVFEYMERIWHNSPVFRSLVESRKTGRRSGPYRGTDKVEFVIGDSTVIGIPMGDGEKVRGLRATCIITDEFGCLDENTLVETDIGLLRIKDSKNLMGKFSLIQPDKSLISPDSFIETPLTDAYKIKTKGGYEFICSNIHKVMTTNGWKLGKDLTKNDYLINTNNYSFPINQVEDKETGIVVDKDLAWLFGALISEGCINHKYNINVHTTDFNFINRVKTILEKYNKENTLSISTNKSYIDPRGWKCKKSYILNYCNLSLRNAFERLGLDREIAINKKIPWSILQSPKEEVLSFLSALYDGDGSVVLSKDKNTNNNLNFSYYSSSEQLCRELQIILQKLDIFSSRCYRKSKLSDNPQWVIRTTYHNSDKLSKLINVDRFKEKISKARILENNNYKYCVYHNGMKKWRAQRVVNGKLKLYGWFLTKDEAKQAIIDNEPEPALKVLSVEKLSDKQVLYDYTVPNTRQFYGNGFIQHNSVNEMIYAVVVQGFAAVTADPIGNVRDMAKIKLLKKLNYWTKEMDEAEAKKVRGNQSVISGTASYAFNHFYKYYKDYKSFIETKGDPEKIKALFNGETPSGFKYNSYSIIQLPYKLIPHGFMDEETIARAKRITNSSEFAREYDAVFIKDSDGFFRRTLIESCVVGGTNKEIIEFPSCGKVNFTASLSGRDGCRYVYGIDPASENDEFAVVITELWEDHRRVVYTWTTNKKRQRKQVEKGQSKGNNFYKYAVDKIRSLFKSFPPERILVDKGGGGVALREAFGDTDKLEKGQLPIYEVRDPDIKKKKYTDDLVGLHILEVVQFNTEWLMEANEGLKKDLEDKLILFPLIDSLAIGMAGAEDELQGRKGKDEKGNPIFLTQDTLEQCMFEIEKLKDELATIVMTQTQGGARRWDTPDHKVPGSKVGRMRKDRYSALLLSNMGARALQRAIEGFKYDGSGFNGGFANEVVQPYKNKEKTGNLYNGPHWFKNKVNSYGGYGAVVNRN